MVRIQSHLRFYWFGLVASFVLLGMALTVQAQGETRVRVTGTDGAGLILRAEASQQSARVALEPEGEIVAVIGEEQRVSGQGWTPVRDAAGRTGWLASNYLEPVIAAASPSVTATATPTLPMVERVAIELPVEPVSHPAQGESPPRNDPSATDHAVGAPLDLEVRFKFPEIDRRERQVIYITASRGSVPVPGVIVRFLVEDEDPEVEREATATDNLGRASHEWSVRRYRGTTVVKLTAEAPDGGIGKAERSFFVK